MGKRALLFPGQGAQYVGMAKDLYANSELASKLIREADEALSASLSEIMFDGPVEELKKTNNTQPAIYLHSVVLMNLLGEFDFDMTAGHSLGEYTALAAAGSLDWLDALKLVRERGEAMLQAGIEREGTMAAVIGLPPETVEKYCEEASSAGIVQPANFNSPGQIVISGSVAGVKKAMELCKENGAKIVKELVVSGAFHSPLMASAGERLNKKLNETKFNNAAKPVYANVTAKPETEKDRIKIMLSKQLTSPVRWEETIRNMISDGADEFIEIGPGKVLQGLVKRIDSNVKFYGIDKFEDLEKAEL
ncbi:MAG: ACP S-malonyltransferase [Chlorobi bacterium]|nr:ACP S-malonyltransferase [Chlorobiota bacterium]